MALSPDQRMETDEQEALRALSLRFRGSLISYFSRRMSDKAEIEDMVQEVFLRLLKRGNVAAIEQAAGYVFETASSVLNDRLRRNRSRKEDRHEEFDGSRHGGVDFTPERVLLARDQLARATAVLLELPEKTRAIFVLRRLEGMRYLDIAARLGISVSAVEKHMNRAIIHLATRLKDER